MIRNLLKGLLLLFVLSLTACGLEDTTKQRAKAVPEEINRILTGIERLEQNFKDRQKTSDWKFLAPYAKSQKLSVNFDLAKQMLSYAQDKNDTSLAQLLKKNKGGTDTQVYQVIGQINKELKKARNLARVPGQYLDALLKLKKEAPQRIQKARQELLTLENLLQKAEAKSQKAKKDAKNYGWRKTDQEIEAVISPLKIQAESARGYFATAEAEFKQTSVGTADYALLKSSLSKVEEILEWMKQKQPKFLKSTASLYRDFSKKEVDRYIQYYGTPVVHSWCESDGCGDGTQYSFGQKELSEEVYNYLSEYSGDLIAQDGWGSPTVHIPQNIWKALGIDADYKAGTWHGYSEFWMENVIAKAFVRYEIVENGKVSTTDWISITEDQYWKNDGGDLGQVVVSKPYGMYDFETSNASMPPGIDRVAVPLLAADGSITGSNEFGEWKQDKETGNYFWYPFLGAMAGNLAADAIFGGNRYDYDEWNDWDRNYRKKKKPYYGRDEQYGTYGYYTYHSGSRYGKSSYARRNGGVVRTARMSADNNLGKGAVMVGNKSQNNSLRGAGPANRGKGASGRGGK